MLYKINKKETLCFRAFLFFTKFDMGFTCVLNTILANHFSLWLSNPFSIIFLEIISTNIQLFNLSLCINSTLIFRLVCIPLPSSLLPHSKFIFRLFILYNFISYILLTLPSPLIYYIGIVNIKQ